MSRTRPARNQKRALDREQRSEGPPHVPVQHVVHESYVEWNYPLPPPALLQQYGFIRNGPDRLLKLVERQAEHRRRLENRDSWTETFQRTFGSVAAFLLGLASLGGGIYLIDRDHSIIGLVWLVGSLVALVGAVQAKRLHDDRTRRPSPPAAPAAPSQIEMDLDDGRE